MAEKQQAIPTTNQAASEQAAQQKLARLTTLTRALMIFEKVFPSAIAIASIWIGLLGLIWMGLFQIFPAPFNGSAVVAGSLATILLIGDWLRQRGVGLHLPSRRDALMRLDQDHDLKNRPATSFADTLAGTQNDALTQNLWQAHRARLAAKIMRLTLHAPYLFISAHDPLALRHLAVILLATGFFAAGPERAARLWAATAFKLPVSTNVSVREDGWIDPPPYTQIPPVMLDLAAFKDGEQPVYKIPVGSIIVLRRSGGDAINPQTTGPLLHLPADHNSRQQDQDLRFKINGDAALIVSLLGRRTVEFRFAAIADTPPAIRLVTAPTTDGGDPLSLSYAWQDDYGIARGVVEITSIMQGDQAITHPPLLEPPQAALTFLPDPRQGEYKQQLGFEDSLWSGLTVEARLNVQDDAQHTGTSEFFRFTLPQRLFTNPLARALDEQRKILVRTPQQQKAVLMALDALMVSPELFSPQFGIYLGLNRARRWLSRPADKVRLIETAQWLSDMAVMIETEGSDDAERALQAAQNALREAIAREAPAHELKQLSDAVRQAMNQLLLALADKMQKQDSVQDQQIDQDSTKHISPQDLSALMDKLDQAMQRGDQAEALRLLEQLRQITKNLQAARSDQPNDQSGQQRAMDALQGMTRDQQNLRDKTYREGLERQQDRQRPKAEQKTDPNGPLSDLERSQKFLRDKLDSLRKGMQEKGTDQQGFNEADTAMREAEDALGQGRESDALEAQNRAIQSLRQGADQLATQMRQQNDDTETTDNPNEANRQNAQGQNSKDNGARDPLGRPLPSQGSNDRSRMYEDGRQTAPEERARALLEELRRRLGEMTRPQAEIDYLKRLLQSESPNAKP